MTPAQLRLLHIARKQCGINDQQWEVIKRNVIKGDRNKSSKNFTNEEFEEVMALFEASYGFRSQDKAPDYWRTKVQLRGSFGGERIAHFITNLVAQTRYARGLDGLCKRFSSGRTSEVSKLTPAEAHNLAEMLKSHIAKLQSAGAQIAGENAGNARAAGAGVTTTQMGLFAGGALPAITQPIHAGASPAPARAPEGQPTTKGTVADGPAQAQAPRVSDVQHMTDEEIPF